MERQPTDQQAHEPKPREPDPIEPPAGPALFWGILNQATQCTILAAFVLYVTGFLIWHSYLASYGISSIGFLQAEYISAAFCYLLLTVALGFPATLIGLELAAPRLKRKPDKWFTVVMLTWILLVGKIQTMYFPESVSLKTVLKSAGWIIGVPVFALIAVLVLRKLFKGRIRFTSPWESFIWSCYLIWALSLIMCRPQANEGFCLTTLCSGLVLGLIWRWISGTWVGTSVGIRFLLVVVGAAYALVHIQSFGKMQFATIPREVGGGKPEKAYLKFAAQNENLPRELDLHSVTSPAAMASFFGPVAILLSSDTGILFVNYSDLRSPFDPLHPPSVQAHGTATNATAKAKNVFPKQIRADLVDAVVYAK